jgi:hypothetical protein
VGWPGEFISRFPLMMSSTRPVPPEDCGGARAYMEAGDPRWRAWWEALPREELRRMAAAVQRLLDSGGDAIGDREGLSAALERVEG